MGKPIIFTDLDDTLFQTKRKVIHPEKALFVASMTASGAPSGYQTQKQKLFTDHLLSSCEVIPVTARSLDQLNRVTVAFTSWRVAAFGSLILSCDGDIDLTWKQSVLVQCQANEDYFKVLNDKVNQVAQQLHIPISGGIKYEYSDAPVHVSFKHEDRHSIAELYALAQSVNDLMAMPATVSFHKNSNQITWYLNRVDKRAACQYLAEHRISDFKNRLSLGMGDSLSDLGFMKTCDYVVSPSNSQIINHLV